MALRGNMFFVLLGISIACSVVFFWLARGAYAAKPKSESPLPPLHRWGRLEVARMLLEKPAEMLPVPAETLDTQTRWYFPGRSKEQVAAFLAACGLSEGHRAAMITATAPLIEMEGCIITPSPELVLDLAPVARDKIYAELEKSPLNISQQTPFSIQLANADIWLSQVGLPAHQEKRIMELTYRRGNALCLSDLQITLQFLSRKEFSALLRALFRTDTLRVRLRLSPGDPIDPLVTYWGRGGRTSTVRALLTSLSHIPDGVEVDLTELLPPLPRSWLGTYPDAPERGRQSADCYYSSLNFFRKVPEPRFLEPEFREATIRREYHIVPKAEQLGDIIMFVDEGGVRQHACVYVADDIVFTKNGVKREHPWVFMRLAAVSAIYGRHPAASQVIFRRNDI